LPKIFDGLFDFAEVFFKSGSVVGPELKNCKLSSGQILWVTEVFVGIKGLKAFRSANRKISPMPMPLPYISWAPETL